MESNHFGASDTALYFLSTAAGPVLFYYLFFFVIYKRTKEENPVASRGDIRIRVVCHSSSNHSLLPIFPFFLLDVEKTRRMESTAGIYV
jgi:hypothetical protein